MNFTEFAKLMSPRNDCDTTFHRNYYRVLDALACGRIPRLIISMPPQHGKSYAASQMLPAYLLGLDPDLHIAITSYSSALASRFNRSAQRFIECEQYAELFPETTIKGFGPRAPRDAGSYIRTSDHVEIVGCDGELFSVGREGSLTGNRVDVLIVDDLYKDAMEANSPVIRDNCWDWYTSAARTRMHNGSREVIVTTRWHEEDLVGQIAKREPVMELTEWSGLDNCPENGWLYLNLEAIKTSAPSEIDPRNPGEPLWPERHDLSRLLREKNLDPGRFECMYQGHPSPSEGLLYGCGFETYDVLPDDLGPIKNYTDTADEGDDYLCSSCYGTDKAGICYLTDIVYSPEPMEVTEKLVAEMLVRNHVRQALIESNNGGKGFARAVEKLMPARSPTKISWFHQSQNKEARILTNSSTVVHKIRVPSDWATRWPDFHYHVVTYRRLYHANRRHDAADVLTGIIESEYPEHRIKRIIRKVFRN